MQFILESPSHRLVGCPPFQRTAKDRIQRAPLQDVHFLLHRNPGIERQPDVFRDNDAQRGREERPHAVLWPPRAHDHLVFTLPQGQLHRRTHKAVVQVFLCDLNDALRILAVDAKFTRHLIAGPIEPVGQFIIAVDRVLRITGLGKFVLLELGLDDLRHALGIPFPHLNNGAAMGLVEQLDETLNGHEDVPS